MEMERWDGGEEGDPRANFPRGGNILVTSKCPREGIPLIFGDRIHPKFPL